MLEWVLKVGVLKLHARRHFFIFIIFLFKVLVDVLFFWVSFSISLPFLIFLLFVFIRSILVMTLLTIAVWSALLSIGVTAAVFFKAMGFFAWTWDPWMLHILTILYFVNIFEPSSFLFLFIIQVLATFTLAETGVTGFSRLKTLTVGFQTLTILANAPNFCWDHLNHHLVLHPNAVHATVTHQTHLIGLAVTWAVVLQAVPITPAVMPHTLVLAWSSEPILFDFHRVLIVAFS